MNERYKKQAEYNEYLWDGSGKPDSEIRALEQVLEQFRATNLTPPAFPRLDLAPQHSSWWQGISSNGRTLRFTAATLTLAAITIGLLLSLRESPSLPNKSGWSVELTKAQPESPPGVSTPGKKTQLQIGQAFETDSSSKASIAVADIGRLEVEPSTRLRLLQSSQGHKRVALDHGTIQATIWAPPGEFVMDTPSATAVDLGCMYTLRVDESGRGLLHTTLGWVGFQSGGHESFIPAGAAAAIYPRTGPGLPYFEKATDALRTAVAQFDSANDASNDPGSDAVTAQRATAVRIILRAAESRDALTLWHLLPRVSESDRPTVYSRLAALVPPPPGVTREGILRLDRAMLDSWWNTLDLGDIGLWRRFEQGWSGSLAGSGTVRKLAPK